MCASTERQPLVIDSDELVSDPVLTVETFCDHVGIPFRPAALRWQPGALEDWSDFSRWHERAAKSTGFVQTLPEPLPVELRGVADEFVAYHLPYYRQLLARAHGPRTG